MDQSSMIDLDKKLIHPGQGLALQDAGYRYHSYIWTKTTRKWVQEHPLFDRANYSLRYGVCYGTTMSGDDIIIPLYDIAELINIALLEGIRIPPSVKIESLRDQLVDALLEHKKMIH